MLDKCPVSTYDQVCELVKAELGQLPNEVYLLSHPCVSFQVQTYTCEDDSIFILSVCFFLQVFKDFNPVPLASASLAQVHLAHTVEGKKVAVKVYTLF